MKPVTIRCYDRYAPIRRLALGSGLLMGLTIGALMALPSQAALPAKAAVQVLPRVEVSGKRVQVEQLPTVVVSGRRADSADVQLARSEPESAVLTQ
ncbi:hypothetical protein H5407_16610 [Mitsuaria sp. WAJ17]|uniref:hypothetical protein n=1 Tax=Mitsuaria sp. WAJ17 TaxID=2761452 RepID=UPI0015FF336A|nr:hypothetical protein [Mitsuaria sp. WAJ17]MBB2486851.1 hypothetical protein [Mitsuaria sp. WAJ17]